MSKLKSAFTNQIGGTWYSTLVIQPIEYITKNKLDWMEGNVVKYITRHKLKHGAEDIKKVVHYALMLLESTYGIKSEIKYNDEETTTKPKRIHRVRRKTGPRVQSVQGEPITNHNTAAVGLPAQAPDLA